MNKHIVRTATLLAAALIQTACDARPPNCGSAEVATGVTAAIARETTKALAAEYVDHLNSLVQSDLAAVRAEATRYVAETQVTMQDVVDEGYQASARKQMCAAGVVVRLPNGSTFSGKTKIAVQGLATDQSKYVVEVQQAPAIAEALRREFPAHFTAKGLELRHRQ